MIALRNVTGDCVSPHIAPLRKNHVKITWFESPRPARSRPVKWTCECRATIYELHHVAGRGFIRRTLQADTGHQFHESHRWPIDEANMWWVRLIAGTAR
jgi:hypothetical protein